MEILGRILGDSSWHKSDLEVVLGRRRKNWDGKDPPPPPPYVWKNSQIILQLFNYPFK